MKQLYKPAQWVPTVYFAMGLPFVAISMASVIMFKSKGVPDKDIAFWTSLIILPWTLKPLWSPLLELFKTKKYVIVITEIFSAVLFGLIAFVLPLPDFFSYVIAILAVLAFSGATHDIAGDGIYLDDLNTKQQSKYVGWQGACYNIAKVLTSGILIYVAGILEKKYDVTTAWVIITVIYAFIMLAIGLYHIKMLPSNHTSSHMRNKSTGEQMKGMLLVFKEFFQKKYIWYYLSFIVLYRFAEGFAMKIIPLFLKEERIKGGLGLSTEEVGLVYGTAGVAAFVIGSVLAGYYVSAKGLKKTIFTLCAIFNIPFIVYFLLAYYQPHSIVLIGSGVVLEYFGYGFGFVGLILFMMQQVAPGNHKMAHYAFATGIMNLGVMIPGMMSGFLSDELGYQYFFIFVLIAAIPAFFITWFVPFTHNEHSKINSD
ncbi:MAG TPA: MFS transporter [Niabella sp.]|nr:MFS transporter [Niabella sp.]